MVTKGLVTRCIFNVSGGEDVVAQTAVQRALSDQVHLAPAQQLGKFSFYFVQHEEARDLARFEPDEHVHIAVRTEVRTKHRPEQGQPADVVALAERRQARAVDGDSLRHTDILCSNLDGRIFSEHEHMMLHKWSDTLAKSKLSPEGRARIQAEVEQELLAMNLQELREAAGIAEGDVAAKTGVAQTDVSRAESREDHRLSTWSASKTQDR